MSMIDAIHEEIVKAIAYGKTRDEIKAAMPTVSDTEIDRVTDSAVAEKRAYLTEMGYIRGD